MNDNRNECTQPADEQDGSKRPDDFVRGTMTADRSSSTEFDELRETVEMIDAEELLDDPEYHEFLDSLGEFGMEEDSVSLSELLDDDEAIPETDRDAETERDDGVEEESDAAASLISALENEGVTDAQRERLRDALGIQDRRRMEVQLNHLKSRFLDLEAYIRAMEDLFDTGTDPLEEIETFRRELDELRTKLDELEDERVSNETELRELKRSLERTQSTADRHIQSIESELERARTWRERVEAAFRPGGGKPTSQETGEHA